MRATVSAALVASATLVAFAACSSAKAPSGTSSANDSTEQSVTCGGEVDGVNDSTDQTFTTVVGATVTLHVVPIEQGFPSNANCASGGIEVTYVDNKNVYQSDNEIEAVATIHSHIGSNAQINTPSTFALSRPQQGNTYLGLFCGLSSGQTVDLVEIAFVDNPNASQPVWDSNDSSNYTQFLSDSTLVASTTTGVGSTLEVDFALSWPSGADCVSPGFDVTYTDNDGFFGGAGSLQAFVHVERHRGGTKLSANHTVTLTLWGDPSAKRYGYTFCGALTDDTVVDSLQVAVGSTDGSKWDSNESQNYQLGCEI